jgi:transglutaminase-like putative cysteine protease
MKTNLISLYFLLALSLQALAQKGQPGFGKVDKADMEMKDCSFDKGADAVVLIDFGNIYYDRGTVGFSTFKTVYERRTRIKILKEKGISQADIQIPYYTHNNEERVLNLNANTYNLNETGKIITTEVKKSSIYSKKIDGNYSKMIIAFPEVKLGSIIEYSYSIERESYGLRNWFFQGRIPVRYSEYQLKVPQIFRFSVQPSVVDPIEDKQEIINESISMDEGFIQTKSLKSNYIMRNLPGIKNEPFMGSPRDYMQRLEFQMTQIYYSESNIVDLSLKWEDVIKNRLNKEDDFGLQLEKSIPSSQALVEEARQIPDAEAKMKFIYNRIRKTINWNGDDDFIYTDNGIVKTWETKTGNAADINLLLIKLLNDAGVKATPILFSTRDHGLVTPYYPFINQFNSVMAYVVIKDKTFVLDATDKVINYKLVPEKVANTNGFIVEGENGRWKDILSGKSKYKVMVAVQGEIDEGGMMKGNGLVNCYDYARAQRVKEWMEDKQKFKDDYFIKSYTALQIEEINVNNLEADSLPLEQKVKFSSQLNSSGEYHYFSVNLFSDMEKNPFIADTRVSDVDFGVLQDYVLFGNYTIPQGYVFDGVPENIAMTTSDNGIIFNRTVQVESNLLNVRITIEFKKSFYTADSYPEFKEFYKKLFDKLNEQVVIKKKTAP